ncbi:DNA cytosine methyltransferase [Kribbella sp. NPDC051587]|uniref:DNA cytosine methyltransferase n=1 Tax=Kribbella sp. NPDC051587 TaxID=3364119 RepID=UPI00378D1688
MDPLRVVEICAGAGGQALGLERAGFEHALAVELDPTAAATLKLNRPDWEVRVGDVADPGVWNPTDFVGVDLLAGGVPCPPFSIAGKQLGANDERDLFAWAVELCGQIKPRALLLENVRGLSAPRFSAYRQHVLDRLDELGYVADWRLLQASDFGVPQLRPRFVLVALSKEDAPYFSWPETTPIGKTVGEELADLMAAGGWKYASHWVTRANGIGPTLVGGSKKHGGADLGPTRAKRAWAELGVDAMGVADAPPPSTASRTFTPKLTIEMVARLQGWRDEWKWQFAGRKTSKYRQIGNAFPPPVAEAVGRQIAGALRNHGEPRILDDAVVHDPVYRLLRSVDESLTIAQILTRIEGELTLEEIQLRIKHLMRDFDMQAGARNGEEAFKLGHFRAFVGQDDHARHEYIAQMRSKVS